MACPSVSCEPTFPFLYYLQYVGYLVKFFQLHELLYMAVKFCLLLVSEHKVNQPTYWGLALTPRKAGGFQLTALCYSSPPGLRASFRPWCSPATWLSSSCRSGQPLAPGFVLCLATLMEYPDTHASIPKVAKSLLSGKNTCDLSEAPRGKVLEVSVFRKVSVNLQQSKSGISAHL